MKTQLVQRKRDLRSPLCFVAVSVRFLSRVCRLLPYHHMFIGNTGGNLRGHGADWRGHVTNAAEGEILSCLHARTQGLQLHGLQETQEQCVHEVRLRQSLVTALRPTEACARTTSKPALRPSERHVREAHPFLGRL
jgi:hypothetical protein